VAYAFALCCLTYSVLAVFFCKLLLVHTPDVPVSRASTATPPQRHDTATPTAPLPFPPPKERGSTWTRHPVLLALVNGSNIQEPRRVSLAVDFWGGQPVVDHDAFIYMYQDRTPCKFVLCIMRQVTVLLVLSGAESSRERSCGCIYENLPCNKYTTESRRAGGLVHAMYCKRPLLPVVKLFLFSVTMSLNHGRNGVTEPCPPIGQGTAMVGPTSCHRRLSTLTP